jgi:hypothetical protein
MTVTLLLNNVMGTILSQIVYHFEYINLKLNP